MSHPPQQSPAGWPPPPAPKKTSPAWLVALVIGLVALLCLVGVVVAIGSTDSSDSSDSSDEAPKSRCVAAPGGGCARTLDHRAPAP